MAFAYFLLKLHIPNANGKHGVQIVRANVATVSHLLNAYRRGVSLTGFDVANVGSNLTVDKSALSGLIRAKNQLVEAGYDITTPKLGRVVGNSNARTFTREMLYRYFMIIASIGDPDLVWSLQPDGTYGECRDGMAKIPTDFVRAATVLDPSTYGELVTECPADRKDGWDDEDEEEI